MKTAWRRFASFGIRRTRSGTDRLKSGLNPNKRIMHLFPSRSKIRQRVFPLNLA